MILVNGILLGVLIALAVKHRNGVDLLGHWRWIAAATGAFFPHMEALFYFVGPGTMAQGLQGITWSLILMPVYAVALAGFLGMCARKSWEDMFPPIVSGLAATWLLMALTEQGIFPLALLTNWRLGLAVLDPVDVIMTGLCLVGLGMGYGFRIYDRDLARLTLFCVIGYVALVGWWSVEARTFGSHYASVQGLSHPTVRVIPQPFSPLNWRVVVAETNGKLHDTSITLGRASPHERIAESTPYRPREAAIWKIHRRFGEIEESEDNQRRARLAWYGWQATPFGWLGRYAVFERMYVKQEVGIGVACVGFRDFRATAEAEVVAGTYVVCPVGELVRIFQPSGPKDKKGNWPRMKELVSFLEVRR